jgi:hypothetical protein
MLPTVKGGEEEGLATEAQRHRERREFGWGLG